MTATKVRIDFRRGAGPAEYTLRDTSPKSLYVLGDDPPEMGAEGRFEEHDASGAVVRSGLLRVVFVQAGQGFGTEFLKVAPGDSEGFEVAAEREKGVKVTTRLRGRGASDSVTIGIDLGTSNTCASAVLSGRPQVIPTRYGTNTIPSVLTLSDTGDVVVGHAAARRMVLHPEKTVYGSKRLVGRAYTEEVADEFQPHFAYPIVETPEHKFGAGLGDRVIAMEEVARHFLAEVRQVAEDHLGKTVDRAVITVPAHFGDGQRDAVRRAAKGAGLGVARIVNEPTAAAVAYGFNRRERARVAVFDLGGGTFDISVLEVKHNRFEVIATGGDLFLGGIDVDDIIAGHLLDEFCKAERAQLEPTAQQLARLRESAEQTKRGLSVQNKFAIHLPQFAEVKGQLRDLRVQLDREVVEAMLGEFLDALMDITTEVLAAGKIDTHSIDEVLLVGGMTRMPLVQDRVEGYFGRRPSRRINPDEAVALGAALLAQQGVDVSLIDVLPLSIGFAGEGRRFLRLLPRNTPVPVERGFVVSTSEDAQTEYPVPLFQGERTDAGRNEYLGTIVIEGIPKAPAGDQSIELTLSLDDQCMLGVKAMLKSTGEAAAVRLDRNRSAEEVVAELGAYSGPDLPPERRLPQSRIGRIFAKLRELLRRR